MNNTYSQAYFRDSFSRFEIMDLVAQSAVFSGFAATAMGEAWRPMLILGATASLIRCLTIPIFRQFEGKIFKENQILISLAQLANLALAVVIVKSVIHIHVHFATTAIFSLLLTYGYNLVVGRSNDYKQTYIIV